jgi:hypothetical protein
MRLAGGLGGDSRAAKESKKKQLAAALAAGLPPPVDERPPRYRVKHDVGVVLCTAGGFGAWAGGMVHLRCMQQYSCQASCRGRAV